MEKSTRLTWREAPLDLLPGGRIRFPHTGAEYGPGEQVRAHGCVWPIRSLVANAVQALEAEATKEPEEAVQARCLAFARAYRARTPAEEVWYIPYPPALASRRIADIDAAHRAAKAHAWLRHNTGV